MKYKCEKCGFEVDTEEYLINSNNLCYMCGQYNVMQMIRDEQRSDSNFFDNFLKEVTGVNKQKKN